jgi:hypothetical protein
MFLIARFAAVLNSEMNEILRGFLVDNLAIKAQNTQNNAFYLRRRCEVQCIHAECVHFSNRKYIFIA